MLSISWTVTPIRFLLINFILALVQLADEQQISKLLNYIHQVGDTARPEGAQTWSTWFLREPCNHWCFPFMGVEWSVFVPCGLRGSLVCVLLVGVFRWWSVS